MFFIKECERETT